MYFPNESNFYRKVLRFRQSLFTTGFFFGDVKSARTSFHGRERKQQCFAGKIDSHQVLLKKEKFK